MEAKGQERATFAGGCFWCMVEPFAVLSGVSNVVAGYTGGHVSSPTYEQICTGTTGHYEAVQVTYDPARIGYKELVNVFLRQVDPTDARGQFADKGPQYRPAVFYHDEEQKRIAEQVLAELPESVVGVIPSSEFYPAEEYHQDYYKKNPAAYARYRVGSGRQSFLDRFWGKADSAPKKINTRYTKPSQQEVKERLTPLQFRVTQQGGTEPAFKNEFWDSTEPGIYVDIVSGEPLFASLDKFDSRSGWPSFSKPLEKDSITEHDDRSHFMRRTEVRSNVAESHLGHVFTDGPAPSGLRYCINSAALRFIPVDELEESGYGEYLKLFG